MRTEFVCAVDVGTASARAGVFDRAGKLLGRAEHPILIHQPRPDHAEHDSDDIWSAVCAAVKASLRNAGVAGDQVRGLCFDATCSLVVRDSDSGKVGVSGSGEPRWDTISWFDHRALDEADECTRTGHEVLRYTGGVMSPEMQTPKLMWLKRHQPDAWAKLHHVFDLADFLTWRATGSDARSQCCVTCKWTYLPHMGGWSPDFFEAVGLGDILGRLDQTILPVGASVGLLTPAAASDLGLTPACAVASGLIDAYAGMLGAIGAYAHDPDGDRHLALVAGTSSCVMRLARDAEFVPSIWGPYLGAAVPGLWASEGGQSATGALLDHLIRFNRQGNEPGPRDHQDIIDRIQALRASDPHFAAGIHILPDFNGNRSPLGDAHARGAMFGLDLDASFDALCKQYWRACVAIALGIRHIVDHLRAHGQPIDMLHVTGGHLRNPLLMELYADATQLPVAEFETGDAVLLGGAMAAAAALGWYADVAGACRGMRGSERLRRPDPSRKDASYRDYAVFLAMQKLQGEIRNTA